MMGLFASVVDLLKLVYAPLITLLAGYLGMQYGLKQLKAEKKLEFIARQLKEFYSPLLGYHKAILAKSELRVRVSHAADEAWREICQGAPKPFLEHEEAFKPFKRVINYDNEQLKQELLPLYRKMLEVFRENYWLAEPETRKYFSELSDFVELWDRWISDNIPASVMEKLGHDEDRLKPFYVELEERLNTLRVKLSA